MPARIERWEHVDDGRVVLHGRSEKHLPVQILIEASRLGTSDAQAMLDIRAARVDAEASVTRPPNRGTEQD